MGLRALFTKADIANMIDKAAVNIDKLTIQRLNLIGFNFVKNARLQADFTDRTGNLRSSIGYIILRNGDQVSENFEKSKKGTDKATGEATAKQLAKNIGDKYTSGYALIVVAGMEYAAAVESKGRDVLTGSSIEATKDLQKYFKK